MSYLLDALRKSEDLKKRGAAPTIHTAGRYDQPGRASRWFGMVLLVLLPLLVLLAWYSWSNRNSDTELATQSHSAPERDVAMQSQRRPVATQPEQGLAGQMESPVSKPEPVILTTDRTPVERLENATGQSRPGSQAEPATDREPSSESSAVTLVRPQSEPPSAGGVAASEKIPDRFDADSDETREYQPPIPGLVHVWELPESVRSNLMEMKISVLVFAEHPEDRFILMNGKRWAEGDEPQPGLVIREIRREGVVFTYRLYRFLVSR